MSLELFTMKWVLETENQETHATFFELDLDTEYGLFMISFFDER